MNYEQLLSALGLADKLDVSAAVKSGSCTIRFDDKVNLTLESYGNDPMRQTLQMHIPLGQAPIEGRALLFERLLQVHVFGIATDQASFGFDSEQNEVLLFKCFPLWNTSLDDALIDVEKFVNQAMLWQDFLPELTKPDPATADGANTASKSIIGSLA